jgi:hypothetical protein
MASRRLDASASGVRQNWGYKLLSLGLAVLLYLFVRGNLGDRPRAPPSPPTVSTGGR